MSNVCCHKQHALTADFECRAAEDASCLVYLCIIEFLSRVCFVLCVNSLTKVLCFEIFIQSSQFSHLMVSTVLHFYNSVHKNCTTAKHSKTFFLIVYHLEQI